MSHLSFDSEVSSLLRMDGPLSRGPPMRWQRKQNESLNLTCNESSLNASGTNLSFSGTGGGSAAGGKRLNASGLNASGAGASSSFTGNGSGTAGKTPMKSSNRSLSNSCNKTPRKTPGSRHGSFSKTPGKTRGTPGQGRKTPGSKTPHTADRFIPNRGATNFDLSHHLLRTQIFPADDDDTMSPSKRDFLKAMSDNLYGDDLGCKLLSYQQKPPRTAHGSRSALRVLYNNASSRGTSASLKGSARYMPQDPERILDAPEILDDYYLNLLDWSAGNQLAVALGGQVYVWSAGTNVTELLLEMESPEEYVSSVAWVKEGNLLAVGTSSAQVQLWDVENKKLLRSMTGHVARVGALSWKQHILSSGSQSGLIHHHDVRVRPHTLSRVPAHAQEVCGLAWSPDGRHLASGGNDNRVQVWGTADGSLHGRDVPTHTFTEHTAAVKALAWCPWQHSLLASGGGTADKHIRFWNVNSGACVNTIDTKSQVTGLMWSPREFKEIISSHGQPQTEGRLVLWKYPGLTKVAELNGHSGRVLQMALSPDGSTVVSAAADETLRLWKCFLSDPEKKRSTASSSGPGTPSFLSLTHSIR